MQKKEYEQLMESVGFLIDYMTILRTMAKQASDQYLANEMNRKADKDGPNGAGTPLGPSDYK